MLIIKQVIAREGDGRARLAKWYKRRTPRVQFLVVLVVCRVWRWWRKVYRFYNPAAVIRHQQKVLRRLVKIQFKKLARYYAGTSFRTSLESIKFTLITFNYFNFTLFSLSLSKHYDVFYFFVFSFNWIILMNKVFAGTNQ